MKTVISSKKETDRKIADHIARTVEHKPDCVIAYMPERVFDGVWQELREMKTDMSGVKLFLMAELCGRTVFSEILNAQTEGLNIRNENVALVSDKSYVNLDELISENGGIDLAVTGIGTNGRFGFNEPGTQYSSRTHIQKLTKPTLHDLDIDGESEVYGVTMGIKTVVEAKDIIVAAYGEAIAKSVFQMLYARDDSVVPAAFLQLPADVTVYLDTEAASRL